MIPCLVANQCSVTSLGCTNGSCDLKGITGRVEYFDCAGLDGSNLYLNGNAITSIAPSAFVNAPPSMTTINLNLNSISTLEAGAFTGLSNVISIMLHKNFITTIEAEAFAGMSSLQSLWLNDNAITTIHSGAFSGLSSLTEFYLDKNPIEFISHEAFLNCCPSLDVMDYADYVGRHPQPSCPGGYSESIKIGKSKIFVCADKDSIIFRVRMLPVTVQVLGFAALLPFIVLLLRAAVARARTAIFLSPRFRVKTKTDKVAFEPLPTAAAMTRPGLTPRFGVKTKIDKLTFEPLPAAAAATRPGLTPRFGGKTKTDKLTFEPLPAAAAATT